MSTLISCLTIMNHLDVERPEKLLVKLSRKSHNLNRLWNLTEKLGKNISRTAFQEFGNPGTAKVCDSLGPANGPSHL